MSPSEAEALRCGLVDARRENGKPQNETRLATYEYECRVTASVS